MESRFAVRHTPPDEEDPCFDLSAQTQVRFLCFAVCHTPLDEQDVILTIADRNEAWRTTERRQQPCVRPSTLETGSCSSGGVWRTAKWTKRTCVGVLRSKRGSCSSGGVWRTAKRDFTGYCSSPPSTSSSLHGLLFIHLDLLQPPPVTVHPRAPIHPASTAPPPATVQPALSMGSCSTTPPRVIVHPALHQLLFNQPSTGTPPPSTVHPALHTTGSCSSRGNAAAHCSSNPPPPRNAHCSSREAASIGFS